MVSVPANSQVQSVRLTNANVCVPITPGTFASFNHRALKGAYYGFAVFDRPNCAGNSDSELPFQADGYISEQAPAPGQPGSQLRNWWVSLP